MLPVQDLLKSILAHLERLKRPVVRLLRAGVSESTIHNAFNARGTAAPEALVGLYVWRDGTDTGSGITLGDMYFFPGFYFMSLDEASARYDVYAKKGKAERWKKNWFPIFADGGGSFYAIECANPSTSDGSIFWWSKGEPEIPIVFESLVAMLRTVDEWYAKGACIVGKEGYLSWDYGRMAEVARKMNPDIEYWKKYPKR